MKNWTLFLLFVMNILLFAGCSPRLGDTKGAEPDKGRIQIDGDELVFTSNRLAELPNERLINVRYDADDLSLELPEYGLPNWIKISKNEEPVKRMTQFNIKITRTDLDAGNYFTKLRLIATLHNPSTSEIKSTYKDVDIEFRVQDGLSADRDEIIFQNTKGSNQATESQSLRIYGSKTNWKATATHPWVKLDKSSGTGLSDVLVSIDESLTEKPGLYQSEIILLDIDKKKTQTIKVELQLEPQRLVVSEKGIAFTKTRGHKKLEHTIHIGSNSHGKLKWRATVDVPWLKLVNPVGETGDYLKVKAISRKLPEGFFPASIRIAPVDNPWVKHAKEIAVGFYINHVHSQAKISIEAPGGNDDRDMIADPIRPLIYVSHGEDTIEVYNVYTGESEDTIEDAGEKIRALAIDRNGSRLYAADAENLTITVIDLDSREVDEVWPGPYFRNSNDQLISLEYSLTDGQPILITNNLTLVDPESGQIIKRFHASTNGNQPCCQEGPPHITVSKDGKTLFVYERHSKSHEIYRLNLQYSYLPQGGFKINQTGYMVEEGLATDIAVSPDGQEVCTASSGDSVIKCYFGEGVAPSRKLAATRNSEINNIEFGPDGSIFGGFVGNDLKNADILSFDPDSGTRQKTYKINKPLNARQMILSSDGKRIISRSGNYESISIINL